MVITDHNYKTTSKYSERKTTKAIVLHCSATQEGKDYTVSDIDKWHKARKFACIGYHYVVYRNGEIHRGRPENVQGAHCVKMNGSSIGVCYIGGTDKDGKAKDTRTPDQRQALFELVEYLTTKYSLTIQDVHCHNEYDPKACPSFKIEAFRKEYNKWFQDKMKLNTDDQKAKELKDKNSKVPEVYFKKDCQVKDW